MEYRQLHDGVSVTDNIEKHAGAPLYPQGLKHPHKQFPHQRLVITYIDKELQELKKKHIDEALLNNKHWLDYVKVKDLKCTCNIKPLYEKILDLDTPTQDEVMGYASCKHTIFAAAKRQMKAAPTPDPAVADDFVEYAKRIIDEDMGEDLTHFGYSYQQWYNHLTLGKQRDMDIVSKVYNGKQNTLTPEEMKKFNQKVYEGICKVEIQTTNGKPRMVCAIPIETKYVTGPICWKLEEIAAHKFRGYCGGKNLKEMSKMINDYIDAGFTKVVEGDGSAFDNTQDITLKRVDHYIYDRVYPAVYHCPKERFKQITHQLYKIMDVNYTDPNTRKKRTALQYKILGSVFSGDCDTTLCNTLRMALYNRYVNDKAGLVFGQDYIVFSKGDDFTVMYKPYVSNEFITQAYYKYFLPASDSPDKADSRVYGLGQVLKMLEFGGPEIIKFCSLRAWYIDSEHIVLTRDPKKFYDLAKYSRKIKTLTGYKRAAYLLQLAIALEADYKNIKIFDSMADAYRRAADQVIRQNHLDPNAPKLKRCVKEAANFFESLERKAMSEEEPVEDDLFQLINDVQYVHKPIKITGSYWDTMKKLERTAFYHLTPEQYALINQQIEAEYSVEELKSIMGII